LDGGARGLSGGVCSDSSRSPDSVGNRHNLLGLTRKVRSGSETVAAECGSLHGFSIDDLIRETDLKRRVRENLAERENSAFG
jgi:stage III sporulation protein SpoIIIAA